MMDNCCAPQWTDFACSSQLPSDSYFEIEHEVHEPLRHLRTPRTSISLPCKIGHVNDSLTMGMKPDNNSSIVNSTPIKAFFIPNENKNKMTKEAASRDILQEAMENLKLEPQIPQAASIDRSSSRTPKEQKARQQPKTPASEKLRRSLRIAEINKNKSYNAPSTCTKILEDVQETEPPQSDVIKVKEESEFNSEFEPCSQFGKVDVIQKRLSYKIVPSQRRASNGFGARRCSLSKSQPKLPKVLTCQYRRRSLIKYRRRSNQFVSMAEAVSKFQNGTPQRFRTISQKDFKPGALIRVKQAPLKLTYPVSPALRCKQRARTANILSKEEREMLELEEMKKHQIKANPIRANILKGPCVLKKVAKKPATVTEEFRLTQSKKMRHTTGPCESPRQTTSIKHHSKSIAPTTAHTNAPNSTTKKTDNPTTAATNAHNIKAATRVLPFSFEARNKELLMKKEEKLKHIQETAKVKPEFHARPAPNFTKAAVAAKEQVPKKQVVPCPFSFEQRDRCMLKKKEELIKQIQEENKKGRAFHANPVPTFKPVLVHGLSKENLKAKEKIPEVAKKPGVKQTANCVDQENKQPNIIANSTTSVHAKKNEENEQEKKQLKNITDTVDAKAKAAQGKSIKPKFVAIELNTDKRAKERGEFEEKIKKKEQEEEVRRQEQEKIRLACEKQERAQLRKLAEVKARPMPIYKPLMMIKSSKPPTSPQSPAWASKPKTK